MAFLVNPISNPADPYVFKSKSGESGDYASRLIIESHRISSIFCNQRRTNPAKLQQSVERSANYLAMPR